MLSYDDALLEIARRIGPLPTTESVPIRESLGCVLAEEILADDFYPRFDNSSVDGYAVGVGAEVDLPLPLVGAVAAGEAAESSLAERSAVRVFTGAPVPLGAVAVVMQEDVSVSNGFIRFSEPVSPGMNVRKRGCELSPGDPLLAKGTRINAGAVGILALVGRSHVRIRRGPRIAIVSTGDELIDHEQTPVGSQIRDTSGPMLAALLAPWTDAGVTAHRVKDDPKALRDLLEALSSACDLIIATGGVSVGGHDFMPAVMREAGEIFFHGVSMRPGRPALFGTIGGTPLFGLPGNPASSFVGCHTFVKEAVRALRGDQASSQTWIEAKMGADQEPYARDDFLRVSLQWRGEALWADPIFEQASFGLRSLAACHGLARVPALCGMGAGDICKVLLVQH